MKRLPATVLLACCIASAPLSLAAPLTQTAGCIGSDTTTCAEDMRGADDQTATQGTSVLGAVYLSVQDAGPDVGNQIADADTAAPAPTVATLALFGLSLLILGLFRGKRSLHRQVT